MMVGELVVGNLTNSLALTADGWHMATHAGALGVAALAYWFARTRSRESVFTFGTGKVHVLAGYTNAIVLAVVAPWMMYEAASRLVHPVRIAFGEALPVAVVGLLVNLASMKLLHVEEGHGHGHGDHDHDHDHDHEADEGHSHGGHGDHNLRVEYVHVLADAFTSVLAILALVGGRYFGWRFLDPMMGIKRCAGGPRGEVYMHFGTCTRAICPLCSDAQMSLSSLYCTESLRLTRASAYLCVQEGSIDMLGWPTFATRRRNPEAAT